MRFLPFSTLVAAVKAALERNATALVQVHNHPSDDPESQSDHIIVGREGCLSLAEQGHL